MKLIHSSQQVVVPKDVEVTLKRRAVVAKGAHGVVERVFDHLPVDMKLVDLEDGKKIIRIQMWFSTPRQRACIRTLCSHLENMFRGVSKQIQYKMRFVYNHFPINVNITNDAKTVEIRNFMGEKRVRTVNLLPGVTVIKSKDVKDEIVLTGCDIDNVSRSCALIHQATLVRKKDIREFLDGIYVSERGVAAVGEE